MLDRLSWYVILLAVLAFPELALHCEWHVGLRITFLIWGGNGGHHLNNVSLHAFVDLHMSAAVPRVQVASESNFSCIVMFIPTWSSRISFYSVHMSLQVEEIHVEAIKGLSMLLVSLEKGKPFVTFGFEIVAGHLCQDFPHPCTRPLPKSCLFPLL